MKPAMRSFLAAVFALVPLLIEGCATSRAVPTGPIELDNTRWKLVTLAGSLDGRVVEFKKKGQNRYVASLVDPGLRLRDVVGLQMGVAIFTVDRKEENKYEGYYKALSPDGGIQDREVVLFVTGDNMSWDQESAVWERQQ
jgi:hypothetical protein